MTVAVPCHELNINSTIVTEEIPTICGGNKHRGYSNGVGWGGRGNGGGLAKVQRDGEQKVLILADSKAAIAAVKKAGRTGRARSRHLQKVVNMVAEIKEGGGGKSNLGG